VEHRASSPDDRQHTMAQSAEDAIYISMCSGAMVKAPMVYRGDGGNVVLYNDRAEAEAAAAELTATSNNPNFSFTVTEFQPL